MKIRREVQRGFTLIDLLVVIANIAILASLLLPALTTAKTVQDLLGRSLAATESYLSLTITDLKETHAKFHPRERL